MQKDMLYRLRRSNTLGLQKIISFYYGTNAMQFIFINNLPAAVNSSNSLFEVKNKIKNISYIDCRCLKCRDIRHMVFYFILWFSWNVLAKAILCANDK